MRLTRILQRESPLTLAREVVWRVQREWNKKRLRGLLERPGCIRLREVPYYVPDLRTLSGPSRSLIVAYADLIQEGRYPFLGYPTVNLGRNPQWNIDFVSGREWAAHPLALSQCIRFDGSDVKVPYELSRLQFLPILGKAYVITRDVRYRQTAKDLLSLWIQANPAPLGVNWTVAMEAALRAMSICFLMNLLAPLRHDEHQWLATVTRSLAQHLFYIEANLEFSHFLTSNHYLSNVVGLYCLSLFLDGEGMGARRREYRKRIEAEMARQVYADGGDYEASVGYHVLVTQFFTTALLLMRAEHDAPPRPEFVERLALMYRFIRTVGSASGELPHVGDGDDGRVELLVDDLQQMLLYREAERNSLRVSRLVGLGQRLFQEGDGPSDEALWYGLTSSVQAPYSAHGVSRKVKGATTILPNSGIAVLRHKSAELLFFAIPNGILGKGSHSHNDKLSFVLRVAGYEVLCDSGTGCYTRDVEVRNTLRSTAAHNTLRIDGAEQNRIPPGPSGLFMLGNQAAVSPMEEGKDAQGYYVRASHQGYAALGVTHTRTVRAVEGEQVFVIEDELAGQGIHDFELNFQLARERSAEISTAGNNVSFRVLGDPQLHFTVTGPGGLEGSVEPSLISTTYGTTVPALKARVRGRAAFPTRVTTRISWAELENSQIGRKELAREAKLRDVTFEGVYQE